MAAWPASSSGHALRVRTAAGAGVVSVAICARDASIATPRDTAAADATERAERRPRAGHGGGAAGGRPGLPALPARLPVRGRPLLPRSVAALLSAAALRSRRTAAGGAPLLEPAEPRGHPHAL